MKERVISAFVVMGVIGSVVVLSLFFPLCIDIFAALALSAARSLPIVHKAYRAG